MLTIRETINSMQVEDRASTQEHRLWCDVLMLAFDDLHGNRKGMAYRSAWIFFFADTSMGIEDRHFVCDAAGVDEVAAVRMARRIIKGEKLSGRLRSKFSRTNPGERKYIREAFLRGDECADIAAAVNRSTSSVWFHIRKMGLRQQETP